MYYQGADAKTRRAIETAERERAKAIAAVWRKLFSLGSVHKPRAVADA